MKSIEEFLGGKEYPGRGLLIGKSDDGSKAIIAYFIMGRSENSRNRIMVEKEDGAYTKAFDESKVKDPSLIIYRAFARVENAVVVSNGDQSEDIVRGLREGRKMKESLRDRRFEPDAPHFTPRISGAIYDICDNFSYEIAILKSKDGKGVEDERHFYNFESSEGIAHIITTYVDNGNPLPSYEGEPEEIRIEGDVDDVAINIFNSLNEENRISLFAYSIDLETKESTNIFINKNKE